MFDIETADTWKINNNNDQEFLDAINISNYIDVDELQKLILKYEQKDSDNLNFAFFTELVRPLMNILLLEENLTIDELFNFDNCTLPIDRITKFLRMLKMDITHKINCEDHEGGLSIIEERYLTEIDYTQSNVNHRSIFNSNMFTVEK